MPSSKNFSLRLCCSLALAVALLVAPSLSLSARAQTTVTGAFLGTVSEQGTTKFISDARVEIRNMDTGVRYVRRTDASGRFYLAALPPGNYRITVEAPNYETRSVLQVLYTLRDNTVVPVPVELTPLPSLATHTPAEPVAPPTPVRPRTSRSPEPTRSPVERTGPPVVSPQPAPAPQPVPPAITNGDEEIEEVAEGPNRTDGRRGGAFAEEEVSTLPLGAVTLVRTFDELALLLPGVTLPPYTSGNVAGPGVGAGVGSAGQFAVNGMPPRTNNFTVDGSDNNDEDIGVRRQGFLSLVPQPIESIREYQVITLLAPAQFGRNIGAQVNAISKSGGNQVHGTAFGFLSSSRLNARNFFDTTNGNNLSPLVAGNNQSVFLESRTRNPDGSFSTVAGSRQPLLTRNGSGDEDSFTLGQFGFVLGGPIVKNNLFFFVSAERQVLNASQEASFAVPTVEQRGFDNSGATGLFRDRFNIVNPPGGNVVNPLPTPIRLENQSLYGAAIFSLFPFPNNPQGVYGANTFTQVLPASGRGIIASGKLDYSGTPEMFGGRIQSFTARYNFTGDERDVPAAGGALRSSLRPQVHTQNISTFLNSELSSPTSSNPLFNQLRLSYGRTRLNINAAPGTSLLLDSPLIQNITLPPSAGVANTGAITFATRSDALNTSQVTGPLGQVIIGGFSPVGVDPFNFPQNRINNTYQIADTVTYRTGATSYAFGTDIRRTELNSTVPRDYRAQATFFGLPLVQSNPVLGGVTQINAERLRSQFADTPYLSPLLFAAAGQPTGYYQSLTNFGDIEGAANIGLRYYQLNFFGQEEVRLLPNLSISLGVRYEYNTPAREMNNRIESTFQNINPNLDPGLLSSLIGGRTQIYEPDRNNIAPRLGIAWAPNIFGPDRTTVFRGGFGVYYDQILGSVVSQSRNLPPAFLPINFGAPIAINPTQIDPALGLPISATGLPLFFRPPTSPNQGTLLLLQPATGPCIFISTILTPGCVIPPSDTTRPRPIPILQPGTLNTINPQISGDQAALRAFINALSELYPRSFAFTVPSRRLEMPMAYHYSYTVEQQVGDNTFLSFAYAGTLGRNLLSFKTPRGGGNKSILISRIEPTRDPNAATSGGFVGNSSQCPNTPGLVVGPSGCPGPQIRGQVLPFGLFPLGNPRIGVFNQIETTGESRYDSFQFQARGRFTRRLQYQAAYTFSKSFDEVSDVFDVAGAFALPQNGVTLQGERARSNFDVPHRLSYNLIWDVPGFSKFQIASTGQFQSGQPYTINTIQDVNADGNLTDRLNTRQGLIITGDRQQPIQIAPGTGINDLVAPFGFDGAVRRNDFRAGNFMLVNLAVVKGFSFFENQELALRMEVFNLTNRANFGIPVRFLEAPGFGNATDTVTPGRRLQFALKYSF